MFAISLRQLIMLSSSNEFLALVKLGIGHYTDAPNTIVDWHSIQALALQHGLSAVVIDGIEYLPEKKRPPQVLLLEWIGEVMQGYEFRYEQYCKAISELSGFYNSHGYKMMVLKGYACAINWPKPEHRPCGDIDIWQFGKQKEADKVICQEKGIKINESHHHHTVFFWYDFIVENHYDFVNVHAHRSSAEMEKIFKDLGKDYSNYVEMKVPSTGSTTNVYLPSPNLHALFLIKHLISHFVGANITFRQILDWAFFVEKHSDTIDWIWLNEKLEEYHMKDFANCLNAICVEELGFDVSIFHGVQFIPYLKDRILEDILNPKYKAEEPKYLLPRLLYKYRRWNGNAWKHDLCYSESHMESFWTGLWSKLLKPSSL